MWSEKRGEKAAFPDEERGRSKMKASAGRARSRRERFMRFAV